MLQFLQTFARDERGVSAVEFALTVPVLLFSLLNGGASALEFALISPVFASRCCSVRSRWLLPPHEWQRSSSWSERHASRWSIRHVGRPVQAAFDDQLSTFTDEDIGINYTVDSSGDIPIAIFAASYTHHFIIPFVPTFDITFPVETRVPLEPT
jgi:Flp pilus assembly pilin Flp